MNSNQSPIRFTGAKQEQNGKFFSVANGVRFFAALSTLFSLSASALPSQLINIYRFVSSSGVHHYTDNIDEALNKGLISQGLAFTVYADSGLGLDPVYRCERGSLVFISPSNGCKADGEVRKGILGYVYAQNPGGEHAELFHYRNQSPATDIIVSTVKNAETDKDIQGYSKSNFIGFIPVPTRLEIMPHDTDPRITNADTIHVVQYYRNYKNSKLLLFLPGTHGYGAGNGPTHFLNLALAQGYKTIDLTYIDDVAVAQMCKKTPTDDKCAEKFRMKRFFGDNATALINDLPQDSIRHRFHALLKHLVKIDPSGNWGQYLNGDHIVWDKIAIAGQSQGGGFAEFVAKKYLIDRVLVFSGGWDSGAPGQYASWYSNASVTPMNKWWATYNQLEPNENDLRSIYKIEGIVADQTFRLTAPVRAGQEAHTEGISDPIYLPKWLSMLGRGGN